MRVPTRIRTGVALAALLVALPAGRPAAQAGGQDVLDRARALYVGAAYEEALAVLADVTTPRGRMYEALCLMALARTSEARNRLDALVRDEPSYVPADPDLPPRFLSLFNETREATLAALVRERFAAARTDYGAGAYDQALTAFQDVLALAGDPILGDVPTTEDFRLLSDAYIDLSREALARIEAARLAAERERQEAERRAAEEAARPPRQFTAPVPVHQVFPPWPGNAGAPDLVVGRIRLSVDVDGAVTDAVMELPMHPLYDIRLIAAAHAWRYTPATLDGVPIAVDHLVEVRLSR